MRRWIFRLLALVVLAVGLVLGEAHYEMNRTLAPLPLREQLAAVGSDGAGPVRVRYVNSGTQFHPTGERGTYGGFLLEWADGRAFAIDLGMTRPVAKDFGATMELLGAQPVEVFGAMSEVLGDEAQKIGAVGFSHLHYDHTDGIGALCEARGPDAPELPVFQVPDQHARGNFGTWPGGADLDRASCIDRVSLRDGPLHAIPGFPGLAAFAVGGHTPGSTVFVARVGETRWVFAGDVTNRFENLIGDVPKPLAYSLLLIPENRSRLHELRVWLSEIDRADGFRVVVAHDLDRIADVGIEILPPATR